MKQFGKRGLSLLLSFVLIVGLVSTSFAFAADTFKETATTKWTEYWYDDYDYILENATQCDTNFNISLLAGGILSSRIYPQDTSTWGGGFVADNYLSRYGQNVYSFCYQEVGEHTSILKIVNPNATDSQITSYFNNQVSKENLQKLTVAFWDCGKIYDDEGRSLGNWDYDNIVVNHTGVNTDRDLPSVRAGELLSELDGLVDFVPDGTYNWTELCDLCDVIICPDDITDAQRRILAQRCTEFICFWRCDPRESIIYNDFNLMLEHDAPSINKAEAFAIMYANPNYKLEWVEQKYRSVMCQFETMDVDGAVIIGSDICYGHEYEAQKYDIDYFGTEGSNGIISLECKYCGDVEFIRGCNTSIISSVDPTCTQDGSTTYKVSGTYSWETISGDTKSQSFSGNTTVTTSAIGHNYTMASADVSFASPIVISDSDGSMRQAVVDLAKHYVGYPYVVGGRGDKIWSGGTNNTGSDIVFDCSGLTQYVYMNALTDKYGVAVSFATDDDRWTPEGQWQFQYAYDISTDNCSGWSDFISKLELGDLIFFNEQGNGLPGHVGIYIGDGQMVDANSDVGIVTIEDLSIDRTFSDCMGAKRIIFEIGEMYPATMELYCIDCGERINVDAVAELTLGTSATCGHSGNYEFHITTYYNENMYGAWKEGENVQSTTGHDWDYDHAYLDNININGDTYVVLTCKKCGGQMRSKLESPSYSVQQLSWNYAEDDYGTMVLTLTALYYDEDGEEHIYTQEITDMEEIEEINESHDWIIIEDSYIAPTCTTDGYAEYICENCGATKDVIYEAYGHNWTIEFDWNNDYTECVANIVCTECGEIQDSVIADISSVISEKGTTYTAVVTINGVTYTDEEFVEFKTEVTEPNNNNNDDDNNNNNNDDDTNKANNNNTNKINNNENNNDNTDTVKSTNKTTTKESATITEAETEAKEENIDNDNSNITSEVIVTNNSNSSKNSNSETTTVESPKTGDNNILWICITTVCVACICGGIVISKRRFT